MSATIGIHFKNLCARDANAVRRDFGKVAASHGYTDPHDRPSPGDFMVAIASGEVKTVLLPDEHLDAIFTALRRLDNLDFTTGEAIKSLLAQLE